MTRAEIRLEAAKNRQRKADTALSKAYEKKRAAVESANRKTWAAVWNATKKVRAARAAVTLAELALHGIVPMETIIECKPAIDGPRGRYCVRITHEGWPKLLAVGKSGKVLAHRVERQSPWRWSDARITGERVKG
jgi:hypothetical protein